MKIAVLSSYPLVDNHRYKKLFLRGIGAYGDRIDEVTVIYGHTRPFDYYNQAVNTFGVADSLQKLRRNKSATPQPRRASALPPDPDKGKRIDQLARELGFGVRKYGRLKDPDCISFLKGYAPDVIHNISGIYIPREILDISPNGVISGHYGLLPDIRGGDTVRWSILLDIPLVISHMCLSPEMDMGDIVHTAQVPIERGDTLADIRGKCQILNAQIHIKLLGQVLDGTLRRTPQQRSDGSYFFRMGHVLKEKVDSILSQQLYHHYES